jgi:D-alanyl-D-alanine carboxypeptidase/D-alanyl-D-alanine-endopeptidase (penicillin-binding protein 4)
VTPARRHIALAAVLVVLVCIGEPASGAAPTAERATGWRVRLERIIGDRPFSVVVGDDGAFWYRHLPRARRAPASNEKLLLSMALLDRYGTDRRIRTELRTGSDIGPGGILKGDLWLVGHGDPEVGHPELAALADGLVAKGIQRVNGDVIGSTGPFRRDWFAPGWRDYFPDVYVALPTALTFEGNETASGHHVTDPELRAARALQAKLKARGIRVRGSARAARARPGMRSLAEVRSSPLVQLLRTMNVPSSNFHAEVLGKWFAFETGGPGSIAAGATRLCGWIAVRVGSFTCHDGSGLSYANRSTAQGIVRLLWTADAAPWGDDLRMTLPTGGQGTLRDRLHDVRVRAKTGTLIDVSALSGWLWIDAAGGWVPFSILSSNYDDTAAKKVEDRIVRFLGSEATPPGQR